MAKLPAFQFYPGDWLKDPALRSCSPEARGVYVDMLCLMFESEKRGVLRGKIGAFSIKKIAQMIPGAKPRMIQELIDNGVVKVARKDGAIYSKRMIRDELHRRHKSMNGAKGGSQNVSKPSSKTKANREANRGSSSSSSTSASAASSSVSDSLLGRMGARAEVNADSAAIVAVWHANHKRATNPSRPGPLIAKILAEDGKHPALTPAAVADSVNAGIVTHINGKPVEGKAIKHNSKGVYADANLIVPADELDKAEYS